MNKRNFPPYAGAPKHRWPGGALDGTTESHIAMVVRYDSELTANDDADRLVGNYDHVRMVRDYTFGPDGCEPSWLVIAWNETTKR